MTHDELLTIISVSESFLKEKEQFLLAKHMSALRAVVELTQTYKDDSYVNEEFNQGLQTAFRLVIQAIEKELK